MSMDQFPQLSAWVCSWAPCSDIYLCTPEDWFLLGYGLDRGSYNGGHAWVLALSIHMTFLWIPAPTATKTVVNEVALSQHKHSHLCHNFVRPRLFTHLWHKKLYKVAGIIFELPTGHQACWPTSMHESLLMGVTIPFISHFAWQFRQCSIILEVGREVWHLWKGAVGDIRSALHQLWHL